MVYKFKMANVFGRLVGDKMHIVLNLHTEKNKYSWPVGYHLTPIMEYWEEYK